MKLIELKVVNQAIMGIIGVILFLLIFVFCFYLLINYQEYLSPMGCVFVSLIVFVFILFLLKSFWTTKYKIDISSTDLRLYRKDSLIFSINLDDILLVRVISIKRGEALRSILKIYSVHSTIPVINLEPLLDNVFMKNSVQIDYLLTRLRQSKEFVETKVDRKNDHIADYINIDNQEKKDLLYQINLDNRPRNKFLKSAAIFLGILIFFGITVGLSFYLKSNQKQYIYSIEGVYYGDKLIPLDKNTTKSLGRSVVKDSLHVFFNGEEVAWADPATFEHMGSSFYSDKNGIYFENNHFFGDDELKPIEGDYDKDTFTAVSDSYFKDKSKLYRFDFSKVVFTAGDIPLKEVKIEGLDIKTFQSYDRDGHWYKDKNSVYFSSENRIRPCPEVDINTFEILSYLVAKDKNNVYYLSRDLESEGQNATEYSDYAILKGADAPSFRMIDYYNYEDKNTTWTVER